MALTIVEALKAKKRLNKLADYHYLLDVGRKCPGTAYYEKRFGPPEAQINS